MKLLNLKSLFLTIILLSYTFLTLEAQPSRSNVPATPHPIELEQPNGDSITIRLFGDENSSYRTTIDGYVIEENKKGYYCYAKINCRDEIVASCKKVHNPNKRGKCELKYIAKMKKNDKLYRPRR